MKMKKMSTLLLSAMIFSASAIALAEPPAPPMQDCPAQKAMKHGKDKKMGMQQAHHQQMMEKMRKVAAPWSMGPMAMNEYMMLENSILLADKEYVALKNDYLTNAAKIKSFTQELMKSPEITAARQKLNTMRDKMKADMDALKANDKEISDQTKKEMKAAREEMREAAEALKNVTQKQFDAKKADMDQLFSKLESSQKALTAKVIAMFKASNNEDAKKYASMLENRNENKPMPQMMKKQNRHGDDKANFHSKDRKKQNKNDSNDDND